jgi:hypothetical protein
MPPMVRFHCTSSHRDPCSWASQSVWQSAVNDQSDTIAPGREAQPLAQRRSDPPYLRLLDGVWIVADCWAMLGCPFCSGLNSATVKAHDNHIQLLRVSTRTKTNTLENCT